MAFRPRIRPLTTLAVAPILAVAVMVPTAAPQGTPTASRAPHGSARAVSTHVIERCLEVARDVDPALAERLEAIRRDKPAREFAAALREARYLTKLAQLKDEDPKLYDAKVKELRLDAQVDRVLDELAAARRSGSEAAADLENRLHGLVQQQVAYSLVTRGMYLRRLNEQIKTIRDQLDHDLGHFDEAVDRKMKSLLDEMDGEK
jgi:hypothetical protein